MYIELNMEELRVLSAAIVKSAKHRARAFSSSIRLFL